MRPDAREAPARPRQLALPFPHEPRFSGADFLAGTSNDTALAWLAPGADWPQRRLAVWGPAGSGKTHLLHIWAARTGAQLLAGPTLPAELEPPDRALALDDADAAAELPLLHRLNVWAEAGQPVLLAARTPPARWSVTLADLASRLRAVTAAEIRPPDETLLRTLLARLLSERQLPVSEPVQDWLRLRLPRTPAAIREVVARLDRASLAAGGRVTRALAADVLRMMADDDGGGPATAVDHEVFAPIPHTASTGAPCLL